MKGRVLPDLQKTGRVEEENGPSENTAEGYTAGKFSILIKNRLTIHKQCVRMKLVSRRRKRRSDRISHERP